MTRFRRAQKAKAQTKRATSSRLLAMKISDPFSNLLIPRNYFGGGKAPKAEKVKVPKVEPIQMPAMPAMPKIEMPKVATAAEIAAAMPAAVPATPVPPIPTTSALEAQEASAEELRKQSSRRGYSSSIIAGESGTDYASSATGTGSLLG